MGLFFVAILNIASLNIWQGLDTWVANRFNSGRLIEVNFRSHKATGGARSQLATARSRWVPF